MKRVSYPELANISEQKHKSFILELSELEKKCSEKSLELSKITILYDEIEQKRQSLSDILTYLSLECEKRDSIIQIFDTKIKNLELLITKLTGEVNTKENQLSILNDTITEKTNKLDTINTLLKSSESEIEYKLKTIQKPLRDLYNELDSVEQTIANTRSSHKMLLNDILRLESSRDLIIDEIRDKQAILDQMGAKYDELNDDILNAFAKIKLIKKQYGS